MRFRVRVRARARVRARVRVRVKVGSELGPRVRVRLTYEAPSLLYLKGTVVAMSWRDRYDHVGTVMTMSGPL